MTDVKPDPGTSSAAARRRVMVGVLVWGVATVVFIALLTQGVGYAMDRAGLLLASSVVAIVGLVVAFVGLVRWRRATRGRGAPDEV